MRDLVIVGIGGHGREMLQCVADINAQGKHWDVLGFVDDAARLDEVGGFPVLGTTEWLKGRDCSVVVAIGAPAIRRRVVNALSAIGVKGFATLVHPSAQVGKFVVLGAGCMISATAVITTDVVLGGHVVVNTGAVVSHDCRVADYATIGPQACLCGGVLLGEGADLGAGGTLMPGVPVGDWAVVGAGATVIGGVGANETVAGCPSRVLRKRQAGWQENV